MDILITALFVFFLFFILNGYHKSKLEKREEQQSSKTEES